MEIQFIINKYMQANAAAEAHRDLPNSQYDQKAHYRDITIASRLAYAMINHPDWTVELQDKYYPSYNYFS